MGVGELGYCEGGVVGTGWGWEGYCIGTLEECCCEDTSEFEDSWEDHRVDGIGGS